MIFIASFSNTFRFHLRQLIFSPDIFSSLFAAIDAAFRYSRRYADIDLIASVSAEIDVILIIAFEIPHISLIRRHDASGMPRASFYVFFNDTTQLQIFHADWADCILRFHAAAILRCAMFSRHFVAATMPRCLRHVRHVLFRCCRRCQRRHFIAAAMIISWLAIDADTPIIIAIAISFRLLPTAFHS
jgi:hypothetical protein